MNHQTLFRVSVATESLTLTMSNQLVNDTLLKESQFATGLMT